MVSDDWKLNKKPELCFDAPQASYLIFDQISKPCFCFSHELQKSAFVRVAWPGRPFPTNKAIHWNRVWPNKNQCISLALPLQAQWASFAFDFPLTKSVYIIIAAHQTKKSSMRSCLIQAAPFFKEIILAPFRVVMRLVFSPRFTRHVDNEVFCY